MISANTRPVDFSYPVREVFLNLFGVHVQQRSKLGDVCGASCACDIPKKEHIDRRAEASGDVASGGEGGENGDGSTNNCLLKYAVVATTLAPPAPLAATLATALAVASAQAWTTEKAADTSGHDIGFAAPALVAPENVAAGGGENDAVGDKVTHGSGGCWQWIWRRQ